MLYHIRGVIVTLAAMSLCYAVVIKSILVLGS